MYFPFLVCTSILARIQALLQWVQAKNHSGFGLGAGIKRFYMYKYIQHYNNTKKYLEYSNKCTKEQNTENKMYMNCPYLVIVLGRSSSSRVKAICPLCIKKAKHVLPETRIFQKQLRLPAFHFFLVGQNYTDNIIWNFSNPENSVVFSVLTAQFFFQF